MLRPTLDEVLGNVIAGFDDIVKPDVTDPYACSISLTLSNLLRHARARAALEPEALWEDNADLRGVLAELGLGAAAPAPLGLDVYPSLARLVDEAMALRRVLDGYVLEHPGDERVRAYLARQLERQRPWMIDAWDGPRR